MLTESTISAVQALAASWDVAIVGAGPAGAFTAIKLASENLKVLLIDKDRHPRPKVCGACINPRGVSILEAAAVIPLDELSVPLHEARIFSGGTKIVFKLRGGMAIDRALLDASLISAAAERGVSVLCGVTAKIAAPGADSIAIQLLDRGSLLGELSSSVAVAAFGLSGLRAPETESFQERNSYFGAGAIGPNLHGIPTGTILMALGRHGYVGGAILADGALDSAAALAPEFVRAKRGVKAAVAEILEEAGLSDSLCSDMPWTGTPLLSRDGTVAAERMFAVGDACGYVEPFTGEGITWALEGAERASPIIARAARGWKAEYAEEWRREYDRTLAGRKRLCRSVKYLLRAPPIVRDNALRAARFPPLARGVGALIGGASLPWL